MRERMTDGHPDAFLMVHVGRLGAEKRLKDMRPVLERLPTARLCIVGTGPYEEELKEHFKGTRTVFTGQLSGDELSSAYASGDMFLMPSDSETLGFLVPPGDTGGYLKCAKQLMEDAKFRRGMGARAR